MKIIFVYFYNNIYGSIRTNTTSIIPFKDDIISIALRKTSLLERQMDLGCAVNYCKNDRFTHEKIVETGCAKSTELLSFLAQLLPAIHEGISFPKRYFGFALTTESDRA